MPHETSTVQSAPPAASSLFRSVLHGTSLYTVALLSQRLASVVLLPINTRFLTPADYGVMELLEQVGVVLSVLLGVNLAGALGYYYFETDSAKTRQAVVGTTFFGSVLMGAAAGLAGTAVATLISRLAFADPQYHGYLTVIFLAMPATFLLEAAFSWARVENRPGLFLAGSLLRALLTIVGTLIFVAGLRLRVTGVLTTSITAIVLVSAFLLSFYLKSYRPAFDRPTFTRMLRYAIPLGFSSMAMVFIHFGDRFILPRYRPLSDLGIYAVSYKIGMLLSVAYSSFHSWWSAQVYNVVKREDADHVFARMVTWLTAALSFCALALVAAAKPGIQLLTAPAFHVAAGLVPVIVLAYYLRSFGDFFRCLFLVAKRPEWDAACTWVGAGVCLVAYLTLIPPFGIWGAAIATALTFGVITTISIIWATRLRPISVEGGRLMKVLGVTAVLTGASLAVPIRNIGLQIAWAAFLLLCYPALLFLLRFPTPGEMQSIRSQLRSLTSRLHR